MPSTPIDPAAVDEIISRQQIADLTMAYCRGVDRIDEVLLGSLFHADSVVVTGAYNGIGSGFAAAICDVLRSHFAMTFHSIANQWIQVTGDRAVGETYVIAAATSLDGATEKLIGGRYIDRFERRDRVWKFSERSFVEDWDRTNPATSSTSGMYAALDLRGGRGSDDPVYAFWEQG